MGKDGATNSEHKGNDNTKCGHGASVAAYTPVWSPHSAQFLRRFSSKGSSWHPPASCTFDHPIIGNFPASDLGGQGGADSLAPCCPCLLLSGGAPYCHNGVDCTTRWTYGQRRWRPQWWRKPCGCVPSCSACCDSACQPWQCQRCCRWPTPAHHSHQQCQTR